MSRRLLLLRHNTIKSSSLFLALSEAQRPAVNRRIDWFVIGENVFG